MYSRVSLTISVAACVWAAFALARAGSVHQDAVRGDSGRAVQLAGGVDDHRLRIADAPPFNGRLVRSVAKLVTSESACAQEVAGQQRVRRRSSGHRAGPGLPEERPGRGGVPRQARPRWRPVRRDQVARYWRCGHRVRVRLTGGCGCSRRQQPPQWRSRGRCRNRPRPPA